MPSDSNQAAYGQQSPNTNAGEFNRSEFAIWQQLQKLSTAMPVRVTAVRGGGLAPVGFVDVQPLVQQITGLGEPVSHGVVHNVPYHRLQGGANAVVIDPAVGDIGIAVFSSRDMSTVKTTRAEAPPGSRRQYDLSDAMYLGGILNGTPTQYVQFVPNGGGIAIYSPGAVSVTAATASVTATTSANVTAPAIMLGAAGQSLRSFVTSAFQALFNSHTHAAGGAGVPNQTLDPSHMTTTVTGG